MANRTNVDPEVPHRQAQAALLSGLRRGDDVEELIDGPADVRGRFTPNVAMLELAVTALALACPPGVGPLAYEGLRERYLPEVTFRGRVEHRNSHYALYAVACMRGGLQPDLLGDARWWQSPLWTYAVFAVVIYARAAAERLGVTPTEITRQVTLRHDLGPPVTS